MLVSEIMVAKVRTVKPLDTVKKAVEVMNKYRIGSVVVAEKNIARGIITERDVLRRVVARGKSAEKTKCREIMSRPLIVISADEEIEKAISLMSKKGIKKLIVVEGGRLSGIITATDILRSGEKIEYAALEELAQFYPVFVPSGEGG